MLSAEKEIKDPRLENHPCFNQKSCRTYARIHLPVAPHCNVQCRFCDRKFSCVNESRPGVTASVMNPEEALEHLKRNLKRVPNISVVGIAGPGDPFANPEAVLETFRLVRENFPELMLCVSTNGLQILPYIDAIKALKVSHVTITVNAVDPRIGASIYEHIRINGIPERGEGAAAFLWEQQQQAIRALVSRDILVKVNTVCVPTVNYSHVETISKTVAAMGVSLHNIIPMIPTPNTDFAHISEPTVEEMKSLRKATQVYLPQMTHCSRCRADAVGLLGDKNPPEETLHFAAQVTGKNSTENLLKTKPENKKRPYVAVVSNEGLFVNAHLGKAESLRIYDIQSKRPVLVDIRKMPPADSGEDRWKALAHTLRDCSLLIAAGAGPLPRSVLAESGIRVCIAEGLIPDSIEASRDLKNTPEEKPFQCGASCGGNAKGCP